MINKIIICSFLSIAACSTDNSGVVNAPKLSVACMSDSILIKEIRNYEETNHLDTKKTVVTVEIGQTDLTAWYIISNTKTNPFYFDNKPFACTKQGGAWVVFFFPNHNPFNSDKLKLEFNELIRKDGLSLKNNSRMYNPVQIKIYIDKHGKITKQEL